MVSIPYGSDSTPKKKKKNKTNTKPLKITLLNFESLFQASTLTVPDLKNKFHYRQMLFSQSVAGACRMGLVAQMH